MIPELRAEQAQAMAALNFDGYAIGGLSVGEAQGTDAGHAGGHHPSAAGG